MKIFDTYSGLVYRILNPKIDISNCTFSELMMHNVISKKSINNLYEKTENISSNLIYDTLIIKDYKIIEVEEL
jgi:hypothetical protein